MRIAGEEVGRLVIRNAGLWVVVASFAAATAAPARAEVPNELEPEYAEATLAYNAKDYARAIQAVDAMLARSPGNEGIPELLELKALSLKSAHREREATAVYERLIRGRTEAGRPASEVAPYHFELGMILDGQKRQDEAGEHFRFSAKQGFNEGPASFYLGSYAFRAQRWGEAEDRFREVVSSDAGELKPPSHFYLGQLSLKTDDGAGATRSFLAARESARDVLEDGRSSEEAKGIARQVGDATAKALEPFDRSSFFGHLSFLTGYDSNPLLTPSSADDGSFEVSGSGTPRQTLAFGAGYATSPLKFIQLVPSYRGAINLNQAEEARNTEFFSHTASLYANAVPLARLSYGTRIDYNLVFQNESGESSGRFAYERFYNAWAVGPYVRYELRPRLLLSLELTLQSQTYPGEDTSGDLARSGNYFETKISARSDRGGRFWNPRGALRYESNDTDGNEFRSKGFGVELGNAFRPLESTEINLALGYQASTYPRRSSGERDDKFFSARVAGSYRQSARWSWMASFETGINDSEAPQAVGSSETFSYDRVVMNAGVAFSL